MTIDVALTSRNNPTGVHTKIVQLIFPPHPEPPGPTSNHAPALFRFILVRLHRHNSHIRHGSSAQLAHKDGQMVGVLNLSNVSLGCGKIILWSICVLGLKFEVLSALVVAGLLL